VEFFIVYIAKEIFIDFAKVNCNIKKWVTFIWRLEELIAKSGESDPPIAD
jgi:hypothetical protein